MHLLRWLCKLRGSWLAIFAANMALDAEKLIECVKKHDILYVSTVKSYKDNNKETAWKQVANELF